MDPKAFKKLLKEELLEQEKRLDKKFASKEDLKSLATKSDLTIELSQLKNELIQYTDKWCTDIINSIDKNKADKSELTSLAKRVTRIEETLVS